MTPPSSPADSTPAAGARFRCAIASAERTEPIAGTASTVRSFLLLEHAGPWGVDALRDSRLEPALGAELAHRSRSTGVRVLLIRRPGRYRATGVRVFAAYADPRRPWVESATLGAPSDVLTLDLAALGRGFSAGLPAYGGAVFAVCTHGRHDACCAELGRPVVLAMAEAYPEETWECSHIGGDRFAGNMLVLPHGLYYGRLDPSAALTVAQAHLAGRLDLDRLRGRSCSPMPAQAAEIALRRSLDIVGLDDVWLESARRSGQHTHVVFTDGRRRHRVLVRTTPAAATRLTCALSREDTPPVHEVLRIDADLDADDPSPPSSRPGPHDPPADAGGRQHRPGS